MVFLWGTLSVPRPTKSFWVTLIAYTEGVVLLKCFFRIKVLWANLYEPSLPNDPLAPAKILGLEVTEDYAVFDLLLLLMLLLHR